MDKKRVEQTNFLCRQILKEHFGLDMAGIEDSEYLNLMNLLRTEWTTRGYL